MKTILGEFPSSSHPGKFYQVIEKDGKISCNCPPWIFNRNGDRTCKHTDSIIAKNPKLQVKPKAEKPAAQLLPEGFVHPLMKGITVSNPMHLFDHERKAMERAEKEKRVRIEELPTQPQPASKEFTFVQRIEELKIDVRERFNLKKLYKADPKAARKKLRKLEKNPDKQYPPNKYSVARRSL